MKVIRETIELPVKPHTLGWNGNQLVCFENGEQYYPAYDSYPTWRGMPERIGYSFGGQFDRAITSPDARYILLYTNLGTKGLLLRSPNELIREVNRSYYCADVYEYPAVFVVADGRTFLVHCPLEYCRLDFEDVETGEIVTMLPDRKPQDFFHSRLEISPGGRYLISKGWVWHPVDMITFYTIEDCLKNPLLLDECVHIKTQDEEANEKEFGDDFEFSSASFLNDQMLLVVTPGANSTLYWWNMNNRKVIRKLKTEDQLGNLLAIDEHRAWDFFHHPKLIDLDTGKIEWQEEGINTGNQNSSIIHDLQLPPIAWNRKASKLAIGGENKVEILTLTND